MDARMMANPHKSAQPGCGLNRLEYSPRAQCPRRAHFSSIGAKNNLELRPLSKLAWPHSLPSLRFFFLKGTFVRIREIRVSVLRAHDFATMILPGFPRCPLDS